MAQGKTSATQANASTTGDSAPIATAANDQSAQGAAAVARIANTPGGTPDFQSALTAELGSFANEINIDPAALSPIVDSIVNNVATTASSSSSSSSDSTAAPSTTSAKPDATKGAAATAPAPLTLTQDLEKEILAHLTAVEGILPASVKSKIDAYTKGHPEVVYGALVAAALADYFSGIKPQALSHKFNLGSGFSITPSVQTGTLHEKFIQSINTTLAYTKGNFTANAGVNFDFQGGNQTYSFGLSEKEIEMFGIHLDASVNFSDTTGAKPSQKLVEALKIANFQLQNTTTWAPGKGAKGAPGPTQATDALTESYTTDKMGKGWQLSGSVTENFGTGHKADSAKVGVTLPPIDGVTVTFSDQQSFGAGTGSGVNTQSVNIKVNDRVSFDVQHGAAMTGDDFQGPVGGSGNNTWSVGVKFKF